MLSQEYPSYCSSTPGRSITPHFTANAKILLRQTIPVADHRQLYPSANGQSSSLPTVDQRLQRSLSGTGGQSPSILAATYNNQTIFSYTDG